MPDLTDSQLLLLRQASRRPDWAVAPPAELRGAELKAAIAALLKAKLVKQVPPVRGLPSWRLAAARGRVTLILSHAGLRVVGIDPTKVAGEAAGEVIHRSMGARNSAKRTHSTSAGTRHLAPPSIRAPRANAKPLQVLKLIARKNGAAMQHLTQATGWQEHSIRAAISGLRKQGHDVRLQRGSSGPRYVLRPRPGGWRPSRKGRLPAARRGAAEKGLPPEGAPGAHGRAGRRPSE